MTTSIVDKNLDVSFVFKDSFFIINNKVGYILIENQDVRDILLIWVTKICRFIRSVSVTIKSNLFS